MQDGTKSVEQLSEIINSVFSPAVEIVLRYRGFISRFAGDAFIAIFPIQDPQAAMRCISAACKIREQMQESSIAEISSRIGISCGTVTWRILPNPGRHLYWFSGTSIHNSIVLQESAESNQILVAERTLKERDKAKLNLCETAPGIFNIKSVNDPAQPGKISSCRLGQKAFVPEDLMHGAEGEFREVISVFINLRKQGADDLESLIKLAQKYGAYLNKVFNSSHGLVALLLFGAPKSYEDIIQRSFRFVDETRIKYGKQMRIGMSMGMVYAGFIGSVWRCEYTAMGISVNLAARLALVANWGETYFEESLLAGRRVNLLYKAMGLHTVKGFIDPVKCFSLKTIREEVDYNYLSPFMGRDSELKTLVRGMPTENISKGMSLHYVYGDPGTGKSRLLYEYALLAEKDNQLFTLQCDGILKSSLHPFVFFIKKQFNGLKSGSVEQRRQNFRRKYQDLAQALEDYLSKEQMQELKRMESILAGLIALDWESSLFRELGAAHRASAIKSAIINFFGFCAKSKPTVILVEDIQWLDADSRRILEDMLDSLRNHRLQIICSARYHDDGSPHILKSELSSKTIQLKAWGTAQIKEFAGALLGQKASESLARYLEEKTLGNLLHMEQICSYMQDNKLLESIDGFLHVKDTGMRLSSGINAMLTARIDRLDKSMKEAVQAASVLGNEFTAEVLQELLQRSQAFSGELTNPGEILENGRKIRLWNMLNEVSYSFSHGLLRDTAYEMQLGKHLKKLHGIAAEIMVDYWTDDRSKYAEIAGQFEKGENFKQAAHYYSLAGIWARDLFQENESLNYLNKALEITRNIGNDEKKQAEYLMEIGLLFQGFGKYDVSMGYLRQAEKLYARSTGTDSISISSCLGNIAVVQKSTGDYDGALENLQRALNIMLNHEDAKVYYIATCYSNMGECHAAKADYPKALEAYQTALRMREDHFGPSHSMVANTLINLSSMYTDMKEYEQAKAHIDRAMQIYENESEPNFLTRSIMYSNAARTYGALDLTDECMAFNYKALRLGKEGLGPRHPDTMVTQFNIAQISIGNKDYDKARELLLEVREAWLESFGERHPWMALCLNSIGKLKTIAGDPQGGLELCLKALNILHDIHGEDHPWCSEIEKNIALARKEAGMEP
jgi:class 3 adenylate cyclase